MMRKIFAATLLIMMGWSSLVAQETESVFNRLSDYNVYYGVRIGYNLSSVRMTSSAISTSPLSGMNVGFVMGFPLGETQATLEPGLFYTVKGGETKYTVPGKEYAAKSEVRMHGFEIPLILKYDFALPTMTDITVQPFFGGFFNFGIGGDLKYQDYDGKREKYSTYMDCFDRFDSGLRFGCGVKIDIFYVELAYDWGLLDLDSDSKFSNFYPNEIESNGKKYIIYDSWEDSAKTGNFMINFGVNF